MSLTVKALIAELEKYDPAMLVVAQSSTRDGYERVSGVVERQVTLGYKDSEGSQQSNFVREGHELSNSEAPVYTVLLLQD